MPAPLQQAPSRTAFDERNGILEEVRNRSVHARNKDEVTMSHHSGNYGGQCPSGPLTVRDKAVLWGWLVVFVGVVFGVIVLLGK